LDSRRFPEIGDRVPRRGNRVTRALARGLMSVCGWRIRGDFPDLGKAVFIVAPHTSNWDFIVGVGALYAIGFRAAFLAKHTVFRGPLGWLMRFLGGIPVDRRAPHGAVERVVRRFRESEQLMLGLAPEGTRKRVGRWKTGFYHIAQKAGVPIVPATFDYDQRCILIGEPLATTGDIAADLAMLKSFCEGPTTTRATAFAEEPETDAAEACAQG
jgi:1-acyl-sn-glycerol-3-phosphate acyltransferase